MDETSKQLIAETRTPIEAKPGRSARYDLRTRDGNGQSCHMLFAPLEAGGPAAGRGQGPKAAPERNSAPHEAVPTDRGHGLAAGRTLRPDTPISPIAISGPWLSPCPWATPLPGSTSLRDDWRLVKSSSRRPLAEVRRSPRTLEVGGGCRTPIATSLEEAVPKLWTAFFRHATTSSFQTLIAGVSRS